MAKIIVTNEDGIETKLISIVEHTNFIDLEKESKIDNLKCLSFVDFTGDTIFNAKQCREIKKEVELLRLNSNLSKQLLDLIKIGAEEVLSNVHLYLKFFGE
jgi:hypothetical protein